MIIFLRLVIYWSLDVSSAHSETTNCLEFSSSDLTLVVIVQDSWQIQSTWDKLNRILKYHQSFEYFYSILVQILLSNSNLMLIYSMKNIQLTCHTKRSIKTHVSYKKTFRIRSLIEKNNRDIQILRIRITYLFSFDKYMTDDLWPRYSICLVSGWCICDHTPLVTDTND